MTILYSRNAKPNPLLQIPETLSFWQTTWESTYYGWLFIPFKDFFLETQSDRPGDIVLSSDTTRMGTEDHLGPSVIGCVWQKSPARWYPLAESSFAPAVFDVSEIVARSSIISTWFPQRLLQHDIQLNVYFARTLCCSNWNLQTAQVDVFLTISAQHLV